VGSSTSGPLKITIVPSFTISASAPTSTTVAPGASITSTITVTPNGGFNGTITLTCSLRGTSNSDVQLPACPTPPTQQITIPPGSTTAVTASVTITTTASKTAALHLPSRIPGHDRWLAAGGGAVLACVVFFGIPARRRSWRAMLGMFVFLAALTFSGCGGGGGNSGGGGTTTTPGTSADTYTVTVTAADSTGAISKTTTFTFTVK
jgi:trimeric autotransporter adhesin